PSMEPENIDDNFIELLSSEKISQHIHLCLQSGSDKILKLMGRKYTVASYRENVQKIRSRFPNFNITTDIIVGFPGESEEDFQETLELVNELKFGHVHTFKYSQRQGTAAVKLKEQISEQVKAERSERLRVLSEQLRDSYRESLLGLSQRVLIEQVSEGSGYGYSEYYVPFKLTNCSTLLKNRFVEIVANELLKEADESTLVARI
ncbi:MAG: radical SAM protein, partial [Lentisphaeria bacterium]